jgi:hypothetical protein
MNLRKPAILSLAAAVSLTLAGAALADDHRHAVHAPAVHVVRHVDVRGATWGHGDINHFHDVDVHTWNGGHWVHDWHGNHFGWWWVVGGAWVFFNAPVYPAPDPYVPPTVVVQQQAPAVVGAAPPSYWYYCASAQNYYPYVASCPMGWEQVPATAPAEAPAVAPPQPQGQNMPPPPPPPSG